MNSSLDRSKSAYLKSLYSVRESPKHQKSVTRQSHDLSENGWTSGIHPIKFGWMEALRPSASAQEGKKNLPGSGTVLYELFYG